ncbi:hypothetical protein INR49_007944 [Caranx melampygus]|nr:hypothetical protein INR49_007944 [Caranx melampygus]
MKLRSSELLPFVCIHTEEEKKKKKGLKTNYRGGEEEEEEFVLSGGRRRRRVVFEQPEPPRLLQLDRVQHVRESTTENRTTEQQQVHSFSLDEDGNVSLTPCKTNVSYKENLVRVFRRRRRPRSSLARLFSDVTETCQSWLDEKVFGGVFRTGQHHNWDLNQNQDQNQDQDLDLDLDREYERGQVWGRRRPPLESSWSGLCSSEVEDGRSFTYDPTEVPPPPDKECPPPKMLIQEEICSEICQSKEQFTQSLGGLSEVPPPSPFYTNTCCCQASPEHTVVHSDEN